ncbi:MAG: PEP-CTERM sorting domain-containing protein [Akkermansiaceae bacterium]
MKQHIVFTVAAALTASAHGASITIANITGSGQDLAFGNLIGEPLNSGFVALYTFAPGSIPATATDLQTNGLNGFLGLTQFDASENLNSPDAGAFSFDFTIANTVANSDLFVVIGNMTEVADSTGLSLLNTGIQLDGEDTGPTGDSASFSATGANGEVLLGDVNRGDVDWGNTVGPTYTTNILSLEAVPEPSSALLLGLSLLALAGNRRRK